MVILKMMNVNPSNMKRMETWHKMLKMLKIRRKKERENNYLK